MNEPVHSARSTAAAPAGAPPPRPRRSARAEPTRTNDPERTQADILAVATREFAERGLAGARIDAIAEAMRTSKRMIYYYFGSKEGLYLAVLEKEYQRIRASEAQLQLDDLPPEDALRKLVGATVDYHLGHPDFTRLVMNENIHRGQYLAQSGVIQQLNVPAIAAVAAIYERGRAAGLFRAGIDPVDLHMSISALAVFNIANRHTFSLIFQRDLDTPEAVGARRDSIVEMVVRFVRK